MITQRIRVYQFYFILFQATVYTEELKKLLKTGKSSQNLFLFFNLFILFLNSLFKTKTSFGTVGYNLL
jgi:hypothetical protein